MVKFLLDKGADPRVITCRGENLLHLACGSTLNSDINATELVQLLMKSKVFATFSVIPDSVDNMGRSALHFAAWRGHEQLVKVLLNEHRAQANARDKQVDG